MPSHEGETGDKGRVKADEPARVTAPALDKKADASDPRAAVDQANAIDETTAGDGVTFFEGGDGRESARADIERNG